MEDEVLAVTSYDFSVFLHVSAVMIGFGATWAEAVMFPVAAKMSPRHLPYVHRLQLVINKFLAAPAILIVAGTGIYQVSEGNWDYGDLWVSGTIAILVVVAAILLAYFIPTDRKLLPMIEKEIADLGGGEIQLSQLSAAYIRKGKLEGAIGTLMGVLLIVAIYFMTTKPGL
jgi:Predicted integral membrane protein (DUF2269)